MPTRRARPSLSNLTSKINELVVRFVVLIYILHFSDVIWLTGQHHSDYLNSFFSVFVAVIYPLRYAVFVQCAETRKSQKISGPFGVYTVYSSVSHWPTLGQCRAFLLILYSCLPNRQSRPAPLPPLDGLVFYYIISVGLTRFTVYSSPLPQ